MTISAASSRARRSASASFFRNSVFPKGLPGQFAFGLEQAADVGRLTGVLMTVR